jgi:Putative prokaryotic signal transducing protein
MPPARKFLCLIRGSNLLKGHEMAELDLVEIFRAKSLLQAKLLQEALKEADIPSNLDNEILDGAPGDLTLGWPTSPRVMVDRPYEAKARAIAVGFDQVEINGAEGSNPEIDTDKCLECGKPLPAGVEVCPACGWSYKVNEPDALNAADDDTIGNRGTVA